MSSMGVDGSPLITKGLRRSSRVSSVPSPLGYVANSDVQWAAIRDFQVQRPRGRAKPDK